MTNEELENQNRNRGYLKRALWKLKEKASLFKIPILNVLYYAEDPAEKVYFENFYQEIEKLEDELNSKLNPQNL